MPYLRPSLSDLRTQVAQDIASAAPGSDPLLRFSNLKITGDAQAALANLHYGYLDWIAKNAVPFTASGEFLEGWAGLIGIIRKPATSATGSVTFTGTAGAFIPAGVKVVRGDGVTFTTGAGQTVGGGGTAIVTATADADLTGQTGAFGNTALSTVMTLGQAIAGVQSNGTVSAVFAGGADLETDDALRSRMLFAYQNPPQGGDKNDFVQWALAVPGVTRAWCFPNLAGVGTVSVYTMWDVSEAAHGGFPQGSNGVATGETRAAAATGDQLAVANALFALQPVTALVYHLTPTANPVAFTISGIPVASRAAIPGAIAGVFLNDGVPGGSIPLAHIWSAIAAVSGVNDFVITSPAVDIANAAGQLPTVGALTFT
ncbi:MAG: Baseplate family protein [Herminiimonas sp.]|nr:Baseplate family protein [Herminiimonas sp.]